MGYANLSVIWGEGVGEAHGAKSRGASGGRSGRGGEQGRGIRHAYLSSSLRLAEMACERELSPQMLTTTLSIEFRTDMRVGVQ